MNASRGVPLTRYLHRIRRHCEYVTITTVPGTCIQYILVLPHKDTALLYSYLARVEEMRQSSSFIYTFCFFGDVPFYKYFCTLAVPSLIESACTSYVFFQVVFFYLVTTGWILDISCIQSKFNHFWLTTCIAIKIRKA